MEGGRADRDSRAHGELVSVQKVQRSGTEVQDVAGCRKKSATVFVIITMLNNGEGQDSCEQCFPWGTRVSEHRLNPPMVRV